MRDKLQAVLALGLVTCTIPRGPTHGESAEVGAGTEAAIPTEHPARPDAEPAARLSDPDDPHGGEGPVPSSLICCAEITQGGGCDGGGPYGPPSGCPEGRSPTTCHFIDDVFANCVPGDQRPPGQDDPKAFNVCCTAVEDGVCRGFSKYDIRREDGGPCGATGKRYVCTFTPEHELVDCHR